MKSSFRNLCWRPNDLLNSHKWPRKFSLSSFRPYHKSVDTINITYVNFKAGTTYPSRPSRGWTIVIVMLVLLNLYLSDYFFEDIFFPFLAILLCIHILFIDTDYSLGTCKLFLYKDITKVHCWMKIFWTNYES